MIKKTWKARPHDIAEVMKFGPEMVEIHASKEDLVKDLDGKYDIQLAVHLPEYDGEHLIDAASLNEKERLKAEIFYNEALTTVRKWAAHFRGTPKAIIHPGGMSESPQPAWQRRHIYDAFFKTMKSLNAKGIDLLVENMPPEPWFYGGQWFCNIFMDPKECLSYCSGNGWGFCFDVCHAQMWCKSVDDVMKLERFASIVRPIVAHIHLSDSEGTSGEGIQIGDGDIDWPPLLQRISGLQVGAVLEIWKGHLDGFAGFVEGWKRLGKLIPGLTS